MPPFLLAGLQAGVQGGLASGIGGVIGRLFGGKKAREQFSAGGMNAGYGALASLLQGALALQASNASNAGALEWQARDVESRAAAEERAQQRQKDLMAFQSELNLRELAARFGYDMLLGGANHKWNLDAIARQIAQANPAKPPNAYAEGLNDAADFMRQERPWWDSDGSEFQPGYVIE